MRGGHSFSGAPTPAAELETMGTLIIRDYKQHLVAFDVQVVTAGGTDSVEDPCLACQAVIKKAKALESS